MLFRMQFLFSYISHVFVVLCLIWCVIWYWKHASRVFFFLFGEGVGAREFKSIFKFVYEMPKWQKACWNTSEPKCQSCVHSSGSCFGMKGKGRNSRAPWIKLQHTSMVGTSNDCPRIIDHGSLLSAFIIGKEPTLGSWSQKKRGGGTDMKTWRRLSLFTMLLDLSI